MSDMGGDNRIQLRSMTNEKLKTNRAKDIKKKLESILESIARLNEIHTNCEDPLLQWLCGPVSIAISRLVKGQLRSTCNRLSEVCHRRQIDRLNHMHGEIGRIHAKKLNELRRKKLAADRFIQKNSRRFKKTRSARHDECHICLVPFENDAKTIRLPHCKHEIHKECLKPWISEKSTCPVCRCTIDELVFPSNPSRFFGGPRRYSQSLRNRN